MYGAHRLMDVIFPFLVYEYRSVLMAFLPIVFIEAIIIRLIWKSSSSRTNVVVFLGSLVGNIVTTLIGYVLQGGLRLFIFFGIFRMNSDSIWSGLLGIAPAEKDQTLTTAIGTQLLVSLLITGYISYIVEYGLLRTFAKDNGPSLKKAVLTANVVSYILLGGWIVLAYMRNI
jgi:hypothetical protein